MITINDKDYYTWDDLHKILIYLQEHGITIHEAMGEN